MKYITSLIILLSVFVSFGQNSADCIGAQNVCNNPNFTFSATVNNGNINELPGTNSVSNPALNPASANMGCLLAGENNPQWLILNVTTSGVLEFSFGAAGSPNPQVGLYDWAMWPYTPTTCNDIMNNILPPVRCNWNALGAGGTGIGTVPPGGSPGNFEPALPVVAGQQYVICISNFSGVNTLVTFTSTGTAQIGCSSVQAPSFTVCPNQNVIVTPTLTNINNVNHTVQPGNIQFTNTVSLNVPVTTVFTIQAAGVDNNNTPVTVSNTFTVDILPTQTINVTNQVFYCEKTQATITINNVVSSFTVSGPNNFIHVSANPVVIIPNVNLQHSGNYTVNAMDQNGCRYNSLTTLSVISVPVPTFSGSTQYCERSNLMITANAQGANNFQWITPGNQVVNGQQLNIPNVQMNHSGQYTFTASFVNNVVNCGNSSTIQVQVMPVPVFQVSDSRTVCLNRSYTLSAWAPVPYTYTWMKHTALLSAGANYVINNASAADAGVYTVMADVLYGSLKCSSTRTTNITVEQGQNVQLPQLNTFCAGSNVNVTTPVGIHSYTWAGPNGFVQPNQNLVIPNAQSGSNGTYTLIAATVNSCVVSRTCEIKILDKLDFKLRPKDTIICKFDHAPMKHLVSGGSGNYSYQFSPVHGISHISGANIHASPMASQVFTLTVTDEKCPAASLTNTFYVEVRELTKFEILLTQDKACEKLCTRLRFVPDVNYSQLSWSVNGKEFSGLKQPELCMNKPGEYFIDLLLADQFGCKNRQINTLKAEVYSAPKADIGYFPLTPTVIENEVTFHPVIPGGQEIKELYWSFGYESDTVKLLNPARLFPLAGKYPVHLTVVNNYGCKSVVTKWIELKEDFTFYIPNAFTPNSDGLNDTFQPKGSGFKSSEYKMQVFNRWGELIYETSEFMKGWDGYHGNELSEQGIYTYRIEVKPLYGENRKLYTGSVNLIR